MRVGEREGKRWGGRGKEGRRRKREGREGGRGEKEGWKEEEKYVLVFWLVVCIQNIQTSG